VVADGKAVGTLASVAWSPGFGAHVALASIARAVTPPTAATVTVDGAERAARLEPLPLTP
jgi:glycine cleavage system aminomethyltransferase T